MKIVARRGKYHNIYFKVVKGEWKIGDNIYCLKHENDKIRCYSCIPIKGNNGTPHNIDDIDEHFRDGEWQKVPNPNNV